MASMCSEELDMRLKSHNGASNVVVVADANDYVRQDLCPLSSRQRHPCSEHVTNQCSQNFGIRCASSA